MIKKLLAILVVISIPLLMGFAIGYTVGYKHHDSTEIVSLDDQPKATEAAYYQSANRDSIGDQISNQRHNAITRAIGLASPAVVGITVTAVEEVNQSPFGNDPFFSQFFGNWPPLKQEVKALGSGFIVSADGYILTNDHVAGNAKEIVVTLTNKEKYKAKLVGTDMLSDISLLKIDGNNFPYLKLGNSDDVIIGEWAIAMGNPFGLFDISDKPTVTVGVVSATGINLNAEGGRFYRNMIQTDAAINQGNSGGPLLNSVGEVIGVNAVIFTPNQGSIGLGFAIPINRVKMVLNELRKHGKIERNFWIGWEVQTVDSRVARYFGLDKAEGAIIADLKRNSPADRAGLKPGDIITEINGETVVNEDNITAILVDAHIGDVLKLKILRGGKTMSVNLKIEERPS